MFGLIACIGWCAAFVAVSAKEPESPSFELRGRVDADFLATAQSSANEATFGDLGDAVGLRRAWVGAEGRVAFGRYMSVIDLADGNVVLRDVFVGLGDFQTGGEIRVGHYLEPFSFEINTPSFTLPFMECSVASILAPARNWGLSLFRTEPCNSTTFALGVYQAGSDVNDFETGPGSTFGLTGRMTAAPINEGNGENLLHLGIALSARFPERGIIIVNQQPQTPLIGFGDVAASPFVPQLQIPASFQQLTNLQLAAARGPVWFQTEWYGSWIDQLGGAPVFFHGVHVDGGWFITGEHRPYQETNGVFGPVRVNRPLFRGPANCERECGWGAWELTARFAYLDVQDADTPLGPGGQFVGIRLPEFTFGANWYLTDNVRLMANYSLAIPEEPNTGSSVAHLFAMRLGVFW
ncbi:OprO/OprP family phosphate-selective porin [Anatilimnocola sp. NA78]|uniref:OprO/OprP family phosphate-selective porin n=1 Tax=Anatilimnocola sp. NA78 TaxID=3415683 RepID=UPI003CE4880F